ncbi:MAG: HPP family protein [Chloroflexota bacterium]|nr:HPP family protein [Chloroflexota bacterium]
MEALRQRLLFASLASSAFFLYLDPHHGTNTTCALVSSHLRAGAAAPRTHQLFGHGDLAAARTMVTAILAMVLLDVVHPPAVSTSLGFALGTRAGA